MVVLEAQTLAGGPASSQFMGSAYEQALWILCDTIIAQLADDLELPSGALAARHTNLE